NAERLRSRLESFRRREHSKVTAVASLRRLTAERPCACIAWVSPKHRRIKRILIPRRAAQFGTEYRPARISQKIFVRSKKSLKFHCDTACACCPDDDSNENRLLALRLHSSCKQQA